MYRSFNPITTHHIYGTCRPIPSDKLKSRPLQFVAIPYKSNFIHYL